MTPKRSPASPSEPSPTPLFDFAADSPESTPPSAPTQAPKRGRRPKATRETEPTPAPKRSRTAKKSPSRPTKKAAADATPQELPPNERPFAVPENWLWTRLGALGFTNIGLTYKPSDKSEDGVIVLRSSNIQNNKIDYQDIVRVKTAIPESKMCRKGDILICARNGSKALVGKAAIVDQDGMSYGAFMAIFRSEYNRYIFQYLQSPYFRQIIDQDVGTTTINQITQSIIKNLPFPLPPLAEQERIVALVERLFARLDEAAEIVRETLEQIDLAKKALLAQAFRGELGTNDPSDEKPANLDELPPNERPFEIPENWLWTRWGNCGKFVAGNAFKKEMQSFTDYEIPFYKVGSLKYSDSDGWLYDETNTINEEIRKNLKAVLIPKNAIVFAKIGEAIRLNRRALTPKPCCIDNNLMSFTAEKCGCRFAYFWSLTLELYKYANATTVPAIRKTDLEAIPFPLPPLAEQARIVALIERQTRKYDEARELAEETAARIETLKKAILARAFRGELGTNDPTDPKPFATAPTT
ncbi:MAG: restriction endonuclease subunit S [Thermoguttaceae bacterium]|nr:restriction endonuclease subunit S [Thermoguttaceae bacterium]